MSCFYKYYYKLQECGTSNIIETDTFELRKYDIGCILLDQLSGRCYELLEVATNHTTPLIPFQTSDCLIYTECEDCLEHYREGCTKPNACNYDPCATVDVAGDCSIVNITFQINCTGSIEVCADPDCTT